MSGKQKVLEIRGSYRVDAGKIITDGGVLLCGGAFTVDNENVKFVGSNGKNGKKFTWAQLQAGMAAGSVLQETPKQVIGCTVAMLGAALRSIEEGGQLTKRVVEEYKLPKSLTGWFRVDHPETHKPWAFSNKDTPEINYLVPENGKPVAGSVDAYLARRNATLQKAGHALAMVISPMELLLRIRSYGKSVDEAMKPVVKSLKPHQLRWAESAPVGNYCARDWDSYAGCKGDSCRGNREVARCALES